MTVFMGAALGHLLTLVSDSYLEFNIRVMSLPRSGPSPPAEQCPMQSDAAASCVAFVSREPTLEIAIYQPYSGLR